MKFKEYFLGALAGIGLSGCVACTAVPNLTPKTVTAAEQCQTLNDIDKEVACYTGTYEIVLQKLVEKKEAGLLEPETLKVLDPLVNETAPRVATFSKTWGVAKSWRETIAEAKSSLDSKDYLALLLQAQPAIAQAESDWLELKPKLQQFIKLEKTNG